MKLQRFFFQALGSKAQQQCPTRSKLAGNPDAVNSSISTSKFFNSMDIYGFPMLVLFFHRQRARRETRLLKEIYA
jgi:hypothetical protein